MEENQALQQAREAIQRGDRQAGKDQLVEILERNPDNEVAWLWLSAIMDDPELEKECLERVLEINPQNQVAQKHLSRLQEAEIANPSPAKPLFVEQTGASEYAGRPTPAQTSTNAQIGEDTYRYAAGLMQAKLPRPQIEDRLAAQGLDRQTASAVVDNLTRLRADARKKAAKKSMLYGALWCVGGVIVTVGTLALAKGGGSFIVAWGAIIFGAIQFIKGLVDFVRSSLPSR